MSDDNTDPQAEHFLKNIVNDQQILLHQILLKDVCEELKKKEEAKDKENKILKDTYETILDYGYQEYKVMCVDRRKIQFDYIKLYTTLSSIIIGAVLSAASFFDLKSQLALPQNLTQLICISSLVLSIFCCLYVFIIAVRLLHRKTITPFPFGGIGKTSDWVNRSYRDFTDKNSFEAEFLKNFIQSVTQCLDNSLSEVIKIEKKLNIIPRILILGIFLAVTGIYLAYFDFIGIKF